MESSVEPKRVKSSDRTLEILEHVADVGAPVTLSELAKDLRIPKSSLHGMLHTMQARDWLELDSDSGKYTLGFRAFLVGSAYPNGDDMVARAHSAMDRVSQSVLEAVHLARLELPNVVYLATREAQHPLRLFSRLGKQLPAHATALGKAILAERTDAEIEELLPRELLAMTPTTITDRDRLLEDLATTRERGYAVDMQENTDGIVCYAVAIRSSSQTEYGLSCSIPVFRLGRLDPASVVQSLKDARQSIEQTMRL